MIKAIETRYKGYRFRSRLEARWAIFFDGIGVGWEYEPQGFTTALGPYLPDFRLPALGWWVEIKPEFSLGEAAEATNQKLKDVVAETGLRAIVFRGDPLQNVTNDIYSQPGVMTWEACAMICNGYQGPGLYDCPYVFCVCPWSGRVGIEFDGRGERVTALRDMSPDELERFRKNEPIDNPTFYDSLGHGDKGYSNTHPKLVDAARKARSARFEHGERP
jgi:hypothetical protein